ncbi:MAG TPA: RNA polymerase sigma factor [Steroidobacteraceae bacterium]|nr:RNA polymerase sigma factor [Steroidobacteraceae bacterium]
MAEDDGELMLRYAGGDLRAFTALYARHRAPLYRYLARLVQDREAADDLFQEVWSRLIAHRARYEPRARFSTYLYRVAHNCCIDHLRRAATRPALMAVEEETADDDPMLTLSAPDQDSPESRLERAELLACYRSALESLPLEQRDVFLLVEQSGLSLEEIAFVTGVGLETAKSRLRYALAKLRRALAAGTSYESSRLNDRRAETRFGAQPLVAAVAAAAAPIEKGATALQLAGGSAR